MLKIRLHIYIILFTSILSINSWAAPKVSVSILPLHDLVSQIGQGVFTPELFFNPNLSPHDAALKPSQIASMNQADLVVWVGPSLESNLNKIIKNLELPQEKVITLLDNPNMQLRPFRPILALGQKDDHGGHDHHHHHGADDPHIWLSFFNTEQTLKQVAEKLIEIDADNASTYRANLESALKNVVELKSELTTKLAVVKDIPFLLLHDSQQYFDNAFSLAFVGSLVQHSMHEMGAKSMDNARKLSEQKNVGCIFIQPQFISERSMQNLAQNIGVKYAVIDHVGMSLENTDMAWTKIMRNIADTMIDCLKDN